MLTEILTFLSALQHSHLGGCPDLKFQTNLAFEQLNGRWYEHSRYPNFFQDSNRCTSVDAESTRDFRFAYLVNVTNLDEYGNKIYVVKNESIDMYSNPKPQILEWKSLPDYLLPVAPHFDEFRILSTDYTNYAIVYTCCDWVLPFYSNLAWILTRERVPSTETLQVVHNILKENNLSLDPLIETDQSNCV